MAVSASLVSSLCFCRSLRRASGRIIKLYANALAPSGLVPFEFAMLTEISNPSGASLAALTDLFQIDRSTLRYKLARLEREGFIEMRIEARDARSRRVFMTAAGQAKYAEALPLWERAQAAFETAMGAEHAVALRKGANRLTAPEVAAALSLSRA